MTFTEIFVYILLGGSEIIFIIVSYKLGELNGELKATRMFKNLLDRWIHGKTKKD